jgi:phosphoglycerate dehydrogenase-like enzyme
MDRPGCLIVTAIADEFAAEVARLTAAAPIPVTACTSAEQALERYSNESVLFGNPDMISKILPEMPAIKWVQSSWAGVTPFMELERRDYILTGVKDVFGSQISEYVFGFLLAHELKILQRKQEQEQHNWFKGISGTLAGKRIGILGTGSIGQHIAQTARCFGLQTIGLNRSGSTVAGFDKTFCNSDLSIFLENLDYIVSTLPQTPDTDKLLDAAALARLPDHAYFVNVGRSNVVDDDALIAALTSGKLAGAALDVYDEEPVPQSNPLWDTPNLSMTAHVAAVSHPLLIVPIFVENYWRYVNGQTLRYTIDFTAGY